MLLIIAFLVTSEPPLMEPPPPDPPAPGQLGLTSAVVCAGSCLASGLGLSLGLTGASPVFIAAGPALGLAGGLIGGGLAESVTPEPEPGRRTFGKESAQRPQRGPQPDSQFAWGALCAGAGYLVVGGAAATAGYFLGASTSDDAPLLGGGFGALGFGAVGGAIGAGVGTFIALNNEPPEL
jgi:hypothetical protein